MSAQLAPPRLLELFHSPPPSAGNSTTIELTAISALAAATSPHISSQTESTPAPAPQKILDAFPVASAPLPSSDRPPIVPSASSARFFDSLFHDHSHPHHNQHEIDEDLPGYKDAAVAPVIAAVKGGFSKAAPFAFLNYLLLLTILYGASYMSSFNSRNTRIVFCDNDGGAEADALFTSFLAVTNPTPNPGVFASVKKITCSSIDDLKSNVLSHASDASTGKDTVVGGVYVPAGFTTDIQNFEAGTAPSISAVVTTISDEGFNPAFIGRAVTPALTASVARYNSMKTASFFKATPDAGIAAASAAASGSAARASLLAPARVDAMRLNAAFPIGGLASSLGVIFLFVQQQVALMMIHPMLMPLFGKIKLKEYVFIRRCAGYGMGISFAFISAAITSIFGTYNDYIDATKWIYLFLSSVLIITTFGLTISFCQFMFGPLAPTAIGIFNALSIASAQFDAPWACLPDFYQLGRAMAMPNGVELVRCVLFGSCYNVGLNVGVLVANQVVMLIALQVLAKFKFQQLLGDRMHKLGNLLHAAPHGNQQGGAMNAGIGMAIGAH